VSQKTSSTCKKKGELAYGEEGATSIAHAFRRATDSVQGIGLTWEEKGKRRAATERGNLPGRPRWCWIKKEKVKGGPRRGKNGPAVSKREADARSYFIRMWQLDGREKRWAPLRRKEVGRLTESSGEVLGPSVVIDVLLRRGGGRTRAGVSEGRAAVLYYQQ